MVTKPPPTERGTAASHFSAHVYCVQTVALLIFCSCEPVYAVSLLNNFIHIARQYKKQTELNKVEKRRHGTFSFVQIYRLFRDRLKLCISSVTQSHLVFPRTQSNWHCVCLRRCTTLDLVVVVLLPTCSNRLDLLFRTTEQTWYQS